MSIEYLNNKVFENLIIDFKNCHKTRKKNIKKYEVSQQLLAEAFYILSENIIRAFKFQMIDKDDMLQEGVMICFEKLNRFDPEFVTASGQKSKAFNYFTTCTLNHFRQLYRTAKNYKQLKEKYYEFLNSKNEAKIIGVISEITTNYVEE